GWLSNSGNNDGALFFPLNNNHFRDYRPQLQAFGLVLGYRLYEKKYEDCFWYGLNKQTGLLKSIEKKSQLVFPNGGYYGFRDSSSLTTIRCGSYKDRPSQADALHIDIWHNGRYILFDPGTYKYNTKHKYIKFYFGTIGHNTLSIGDHDQMLKGNRFIWYFWTKCKEEKIEESRSAFEFKGKIYGFPTVGNKIYHERKICKIRNRNEWRIIDKTNYKGNEPVMLHWNVHPDYLNYVDIQTIGKKNEKLAYLQKIGWYSELYGIKKEYIQIYCIVPDGCAITTIKINL
ncbi:MAG: heparinase II/III-family protein, partial [Clostridiales bacterium]|nr:heparinase II/III-family protein [Clostridiales bacterium]